MSLESSRWVWTHTHTHTRS